MRFVNVLDEVLGQRSKVTLLRLLIRTRGEHTGRELARMVSLDHKTCHAALRDLARQGVVASRPVGNALAYRLNADHALVGGILVPAFSKEEELIEDYAQEVRKGLGQRVESIVLFGSVARSEEEETSDVDLLFIFRDEAKAKAAQAKIQDVMSHLARRYGNVPQMIVVTERQLRNNISHGLPLFRSILQTGRVLYGKSFAEILKHGGKADRYTTRSQG